MDRQGFLDYNTRLSPENSRKAAIKRGQTKVRFQYAEREQARPKVKASSYAMAIRILDEVLVHQSVVDLHGQSLYNVRDMAVLEKRLNPCNGICLSALYDKAFDQGLITFSPDDYSVVLSSALRENETKDYYDKYFGIIAGNKLSMPTEYLPNRNFLAYHRDHLFVGG